MRNIVLKLVSYIMVSFHGPTTIPMSIPSPIPSQMATILNAEVYTVSVLIHFPIPILIPMAPVPNFILILVPIRWNYIGIIIGMSFSGAFLNRHRNHIISNSDSETDECTNIGGKIGYCSHWKRNRNQNMSQCRFSGNSSAYYYCSH